MIASVSDYSAAAISVNFLESLLVCPIHRTQIIIAHNFVDVWIKWTRLFESALAPETSTNPTGNIDLSTVLSSSEPVIKLDSDSARALSVDLPNTGEVPVLLPWARRLNFNKRCR